MLGLTWFTAFIVQGLGFSQSAAGPISVLPWVFGACVVIATGWLSQRLVTRGMSTRHGRGVLGATPLIVGGALLMLMPYAHGAGLHIALLVVGAGLCGSIYVVCPPMLSEFTPVSQRGAVIAIYGAIYTLAGIVAPVVMGHIVQAAGSSTQGYLHGFAINGVVMIAAGVLGLLLLRPGTERARLARRSAQTPQFARG